MDIGKLADIVDFASLGSLSRVERIFTTAKAAGDAVGRLNEELKDGRSVMNAENMDELRPLLDRITISALDDGEKLDAELEAAKRR